MKKIAVILRGHIRSWKIIHEHAFAFYESLADEVDYYFTTYKIEGYDYSNVKNTFKNRNLIKFLLVPTEDRVNPNNIYNSWYGPAYLVYRILPYMRQHIKNTQYDAIIDSRPDVLCRLKKTPLPPQTNTLHTHKVEIHNNYITGKDDLAIGDHFFMYDFETCIKLADRHIAPCPYGNQIQHRMYLEEQRIDLNVIDWVEAYITRPNIDKIINDNVVERMGECYDLFDEWNQMPSDEKIAYCHKYDIALQDYLDTDTYHSQIYKFHQR
jgi:hypothetical protein